MSADDLSVRAYELLGSLPRTSRGAKHALRATCPTSALTLAATYVDSIALDELIESWLVEDNVNRSRRVGRPEKVGPRAYLIALLACTYADLPVSLAQIHHTLVSPDMPTAIRRSLGFGVDSRDATTDAAFEAARRSIGYDAVTRTAEKVARTFDPRPFPKNRGLEPEEIARIDKGRDPALVALRQRRADELQSLMPYGTYRMIPEHVRSRWTGDITLDATVVPVHGRRGHGSRARRSRTSQSPEVNAGWHVKDPDKRDEGADPTSASRAVWTFGLDWHLAQMTGGPDCASFPRLIVGTSLDRPSYDPGANAVAALQGIRNRGLPAGIVTTDLGYSQLHAANYALPARDLGYELMHMFKSNNLGIQTDREYKGPPNLSGFVVVEGTLYGPCIPTRLIDASKDFAAGRITAEEYEARIEARRAHQARLKSTKDGDLSAVYRCPGAGDGRTVHCDLKPPSPSQLKKEQKAMKGGRPMLPLVINTPAAPPKCCTNKTSVSIPKDWAARFLTAMPYKTPEWKAYYATARNQMEGRNGELKDALGVDIRDAGQRRFRGFGKQLIALLAKVVASNIKVLIAWVERRDDKSATPPRNRGGRPRTARREPHTADPNGPPVRIINTPKQDRRAA